MGARITLLLERLLFGPNDNIGTATKGPAVSDTNDGNASPSTSYHSSTLTDVTIRYAAKGSQSPTFNSENAAHVAVYPKPSKDVRAHPHAATVSRPRSLWQTAANTWSPTILQPRPLAAIFALCVAIACTFASLAILVTSDGSPIDNWPVSICDSTSRRYDKYWASFCIPSWMSS